MKKFFKAVLVAIVFVVAVNLFAAGSEARANTASDKQDLITVVRSVENGVHYISVFVGDVMVCKDIEM